MVFCKKKKITLGRVSFASSIPSYTTNVGNKVMIYICVKVWVSKKTALRSTAAVAVET